MSTCPGLNQFAAVSCCTAHHAYPSCALSHLSSLVQRPAWGRICCCSSSAAVVPDVNKQTNKRCMIDFFFFFFEQLLLYSSRTLFRHDKVAFGVFSERVLLAFSSPKSFRVNEKALSVYLSVFVSLSLSLSVSPGCVCERERESVYVCVRKRDGESVCVCVNKTK